MGKEKENNTIGFEELKELRDDEKYLILKNILNEKDSVSYINDKNQRVHIIGSKFPSSQIVNEDYDPEEETPGVDISKSLDHKKPLTYIN